MIISTEGQVSLHIACFENIDEIYELYSRNSQRLTEFYFFDFDNTDRNSIMSYIEKGRDLYNVKKSVNAFIVFNDQFIGELSITRLKDKQSTCGLSVWVDYSYQNCGMGSTSIRMAETLCLSWEINVIKYAVSSKNTASIKLAVNTGFVKSDDLHQVFENGVLCEGLLYTKKLKLI